MDQLPNPKRQSIREPGGHTAENGASDGTYETCLDQVVDAILSQSRDDANGALAGVFLNVERAKREWEATVDALPELICVVDEDGLLVRANRTVESWSLGPVRRVRGQRVHSLLHPNCEGRCHFDEFLQGATEHAVSGQASEHEAYDAILRRHLLVRILPVRRTKRDLKRHVAIIVQDITSRKEMEQALKRNNERLNVLNAINGAVLKAQTPEDIAHAVLKHVRPLVPFHQAYVFSLDAEQESFELLASALQTKVRTGRGISFAHEAMGKNTSRMLTELFIVNDIRRQPSISSFEAQMVEQGTESYMSVPLQSGNIAAGTIVVGMRTFDDFTSEQIQIVREVGELLTIAIRQTRLYRKLTRTNRELQEVLRLRHASTVGLKGELAPNMNAQGGKSQLASTEIFGPMTAAQIMAMNGLGKDGDQLYFMVNGLFRLSSVVDSNLEKATISLDLLVEEEISSWEMALAAHGVALTLYVASELPTLSADPKRLRQVLSLLLDNALTNSGPGSRIDLRLWQEASCIMLAITDQGSPIEQPAREGMLAHQHRARESMPETAVRIGLGLALCESIIRAHGGRIWAERGENDGGGCFRIALPFGATDPD